MDPDWKMFSNFNFRLKGTLNNGFTPHPIDMGIFLGRLSCNLPLIPLHDLSSKQWAPNLRGSLKVLRGLIIEV